MTETIICMKDLELKKFYKYVDISYSFGYNIESGIRNTKMALACGSSRVTGCGIPRWLRLVVLH